MNESKTANSLSKKAISNATSGFLFFIVNTIISIILNPILVTSLGTTYFGIWKSIDSFLGFASIADGKSTQALKWTIANQESSNDFNKKKREVGSALIVWFIFLPILIVIIGLLIYYSPYLIHNMKQEDYDLIRFVVFILGLNLILTPLFGMSESVLVGVNNGYMANYIKTVWIILSAFFMYYALLLNYSIKALAIITVLITLLRGINYFQVCRSRVEWFGISKPKKSEILFFFKFSSWKLVWSFVARFLMSSEIIFLSILVGASSVSQYIFTAYISVIGITVAAIISSAITPGLGRIIGNREYQKSQKIIAQMRELVLAVSLFIAAGILLLNKSFVSLWAGSDLFLGNMSNILIAALMIQLLIIRNEAFLIDLSLDIKTKVMIGIATIVMIITFILVIYTYVFNDINSIFMGIFLGRLFMFFSFPIITNKMIRHTGDIIPFKYIFHSIIFLSIVVIIGNIQFLDTWIDLFLIGSFEIFLSVLYIYFFITGENNKSIIKLKLICLKEKLWR